MSVQHQMEAFMTNEELLDHLLHAPLKSTYSRDSVLRLLGIKAQEEVHKFPVNNGN